MREDNFPHPVSDPAGAGLPEYADEDSTADDDVPSAREADGPSPAALPLGRGDSPLAVEDFGITAEERRQGEPLTGRLAREEPDVAPVEPVPSAERGADPEPEENEWFPVDPPEATDDGPVDPQLESPVSMYERIGDDPVTGGTVGRLVQPDQGAGLDTEKDEVGIDAGAAGGGPSAEEAALREIRP
ncbi:MAG TPA: DUF5709 domain-containing protein [Cryptosporangiaceae bacterium]|nr:DUF5709 domain-containing protein [Cryptosporangiaceae bacterium]